MSSPDLAPGPVYWERRDDYLVPWWRWRCMINGAACNDLRDSSLVSEERRLTRERKQWAGRCKLLLRSEINCQQIRGLETGDSLQLSTGVPLSSPTPSLPLPPPPPDCQEGERLGRLETTKVRREPHRWPVRQRDWTGVFSVIWLN